MNRIKQALAGAAVLASSLFVGCNSIFGPDAGLVRLSEVHELVQEVATRTTGWDESARPVAEHATSGITPDGLMPRPVFAGQVIPLLDLHDDLAPSKADPLVLKLYLSETRVLRMVAEDPQAQ